MVLLDAIRRLVIYSNGWGALRLAQTYTIYVTVKHRWQYAFFSVEGLFHQRTQLNAEGCTTYASLLRRKSGYIHVLLLLWKSSQLLDYSENVLYLYDRKVGFISGNAVNPTECYALLERAEKRAKYATDRNLLLYWNYIIFFVAFGVPNYGKNIENF